MFVLSCNLGQRFSDMVRIEKSCFDLIKNTFRIIQKKTGNLSIVNLDKYCLDKRTTLEILNKYNFEAPYKGDISCYDKYLKMLLKYIGEEFFNEIRVEEKVNGELLVQQLYKYKMVSSHTARRTFATINLERGHLVQNIKRATGHKTISAFEKYICFSDSDFEFS